MCECACAVGIFDNCHCTSSSKYFVNIDAENDCPEINKRLFNINILCKLLENLRNVIVYWNIYEQRIAMRYTRNDMVENISRFTGYGDVSRLVRTMDFASWTVILFCLLCNFFILHSMTCVSQTPFSIAKLGYRTNGRWQILTKISSKLKTWNYGRRMGYLSRISRILRHRN